MTEKEQLLPCPFCGGEHGGIMEHQDPPYGFYKWTVWHYCDDGSFICLKANIKQEAINKWNTRAMSADEKEQIRRLKAFVNLIFSYGEVDIYCIDNMNFAIDQGLIEGEYRNGVFLYKKADWLKDENK